jgi:hypothetical protein
VPLRRLKALRVALASEGTARGEGEDWVKTQLRDPVVRTAHVRELCRMVEAGEASEETLRKGLDEIAALTPPEGDEIEVMSCTKCGVVLAQGGAMVRMFCDCPLTPEGDEREAGCVVETPRELVDRWCLEWGLDELAERCLSDLARMIEKRSGCQSKGGE